MPAIITNKFRLPLSEKGNMLVTDITLSGITK